MIPRFTNRHVSSDRSVILCRCTRPRSSFKSGKLLSLSSTVKLLFLEESIVKLECFVASIQVFGLWIIHFIVEITDFEWAAFWMDSILIDVLELIL